MAIDTRVNGEMVHNMDMENAIIEEVVNCMKENGRMVSYVEPGIIKVEPDTKVSGLITRFMDMEHFIKKKVVNGMKENGRMGNILDKGQYIVPGIDMKANGKVVLDMG